jgi:hypothetical protein
MEKARADINAIAQSLGLSLKDLLGTSESKGKVRKLTGKILCNTEIRKMQRKSGPAVVVNQVG